MGRSAIARQGQRKGDFLAGKYLLEDCLGIGGMGEVYRATNVSLGRAVAIKLLSPELVNIEADVLRFLREARAAAAVRHTNVVDVLDVARDEDGTPFIVQELLSGEDLEHYLNRRGGRLSCTEALEIMFPVADAVAAAHARDVVHRDLKPANIFLAKDRDRITPKVLDFGACLFPTIAERSTKEVRMLIGTPHYMAPEQIVSKADVDQRSDVWALGVILYEMIVGETPFEAGSAKAVMELVKTRDVPPLRQRAKDAPADLEELIAQCTKRDRLARLPSAAVVHERMATVLARMRMENRGAHATIGSLDDLDDPIKPSATTPKAAKAPPALPRDLMTLSSPGSEPPPFSVDSVDGANKGDKREVRPIQKAPPPPTPRAAEPPKKAPALDPPGGVRSLDFDALSEPEPREVALAAHPASWPPGVQRSPSTPAVSSLPPVLDPRAAGRGSPKIPPAPAPPKDIRAALEAVESALDLPEPPRSEHEPPAVEASKGDAPNAESPKGDVPNENLSTSVARSAQRAASGPAPMGMLLTAVGGPAVVGALAVRLIPAVGGPIGRALRGDSTFASGVLAVAALLGAAALCARSLLGERTRPLIIAAVGSVLFGIVMIIVTFSASEAAELGMPSSTTGLPTLVAPIAPLAVAVAAIVRARSAWAKTYTRSDAIRSAALASVLLFVALVLSPIGAVRTPSPSSPPSSARTSG